jgi:hypothetical protein
MEQTHMNRALATERESAFSYGWKIRVVWSFAAVVGMLSERAGTACRNWATGQAYRLGRSDYGVHFNTPRFSRNTKLADAYDNGAYDTWVQTPPRDDWLRDLLPFT